jgi:hypothetical protein
MTRSGFTEWLARTEEGKEIVRENKQNLDRCEGDFLFREWVGFARDCLLQARKMFPDVSGIIFSSQSSS